MTFRPFRWLITFSSSLGSIAWTHQPIVSQPAVNKPVVDKPVVSKPTVGKPAVGKPTEGALEEVKELSVCQQGQKAGGQLIGRLAKAVTLTSEKPLTCQAEVVFLPPPEAQGRLSGPPPAPFLHLMGKVRRLPWPGVPGSSGSPGSPPQVLIQMVWVGVTSPHHPPFTVSLKQPLVSLLKVPREGNHLTLPQGLRLPLHGPWQELCQAAQRLASLTRFSKNTLSTEDIPAEGTPVGGSPAGGISARSVPAGGSPAGDLSASRLPAQGTEGTPSVWIATNPQSQARRVAALPALPVATPGMAALGGGSTQEANDSDASGIAVNKGGESSQARAGSQGPALERQGQGANKGGGSQLPASSAARGSAGRSFQGNPFQRNSFQGHPSPGRPSFSAGFPAGSYGNSGAWEGPSFGSSGFYGGAHPLFPSGTFPQAFAPGSTQGAAPAEAAPAEAVPAHAVPVEVSASQDPSPEATASPARAGEETTPAPESSAPESPREAAAGEAASPPPLNPLGTREDPVSEPFTVPALQVRVTTQGCPPRVDLKQNRVVIQTKSVTVKEGRVIHETPCGDSHVWYPIHKDWACPDVRDEKARVAYSCYRRYWEDKKDRRTYLDNTCQRDESRPHPYAEDPTPCTHKVDWDARQAYRQAQTVYYNRANVRQVVAACHPLPAPPLPLVDVRHGCKPLHYFEQNLSVIQKRTLFHDAGQDYEVLPCTPTLETVPHVFVKGDCTSTFVDGHFQGFGKRQIILEGKKTLITDTCEPLPSEHIQATLDGCEGQWEQDFEAGRCYQKVRWYYNAQGRKKFLTGCLRGTLFYPHRLEIGTYEHDDRNRSSKPVYKMFFEKDGKQHYVTLYGETDPKKFIAHIYQGEFSFISHTTVYSNQDHLPGQLHPHSASMQVWLRPDGSTYHVR